MRLAAPLPPLWRWHPLLASCRETAVRAPFQRHFQTRPFRDIRPPHQARSARDALSEKVRTGYGRSEGAGIDFLRASKGENVSFGLLGTRPGT